MFSVSQIECINLQKGSLQNKIILIFVIVQLHLKGSFFCVKRFQPIIRLAILNVPHMGFLCYLNSDEILL